MIKKIGELIVSHSIHLFGVELTPNQIVFQQTKKEFEGDTTLLIFPIAKICKKNPIELSQLLGEFLSQHFKEIKSFQVVQGFLNLSFHSSFWINQIKDIYTNPTYGNKEKKKDLLLVEFASPNTNKPLHLGHLRNIFLGNAVANLLEAEGYEVIKTQIVNDRGIHICKSMLAWEKFSPINEDGERENPTNTGLKGDKLVGKYYVIFDKKWNEETSEILNDWQNNNFENYPEELIKELKKLQFVQINKDEEARKEIDAKIKDLAKNFAPLLQEAKQTSNLIKIITNLIPT